jgi:thioredoxin reductase
MLHPACRLAPIAKPEITTMDDVIIIGGSFAGLAGALQLGRARRKVTVLDTGLPRNRFASHSHGVLGHDHKPPQNILAAAREQLARYPGVSMVNARAEAISGSLGDFAVRTDAGETLRARRLLLAYGISDQMPAIPGFAQCWGKTIVPCPYCDGFEVAGQHWGLLWSGPHSQHAVALYHDWTDHLTVFANGHDIVPDIRADLVRRKVELVDGKVAEIVHSDGLLTSIMLDTGRAVALDVLFAHPHNRPASDLHEALGLETVPGPVGIVLKVDDRRETSMPGIYAAGDLANPMASVTLAAAHGAMAAIFAQQSMLD